MRAVRLHAFGPPENLLVEQVPDPVPGAGQALIRVEAGGVQVAETMLRRGLTVGPHVPPALPAVLGGDVAGTVVAVGPDVDAEWVGRRVVGGGELGGYAELTAVDTADLLVIPAGLDADVALAMTTTGTTAMGLLEQARPSAGDVVLVPAAAGGIGALLVQAARNAGATVVGAASGDKLETVRALGAEVAVDYRRPGWDEEVREALGERAVSVVLDGVGGEAGRTALELLGPGGRILLHGWSSGEPTRIDTADLIERQLTAVWTIGPRMLGRWAELRAEALTAAAEGRLTPLITRFALDEAARAHAALEGRATVGTVVLVP